MIRTFAGFIVLLTTVGCFPSPLLSHADAEDIKDDSQAAVASGCQFRLPKHELCAALSWVQRTTEDSEGEFLLRFWNPVQGNEHGPFVSPTQDVAVKLWMPSMGHGSSPVKVAAEVDASGATVPGVFRATKVFFVMPGAWEIWVQLKKEKKVLEQAKIDYHL